MQDKQKQFIQLIIGWCLIMIMMLLLVYKCYEIDRLIYQHNLHYEYITLGDVGKDLIKKFLNWLSTNM